MTNLSQEDLYILLGKLRDIFNSGIDSPVIIPNEALEAFMSHCFNKIGDSYFKTPRNTIKAFLDLMDVLEQNEQLSWSDMLEQISITRDRPVDSFPENGTVETVMQDVALEDEQTEGWANFKL